MTVQELMQSMLLRFGQSPDNTRFSDDFYGALNDSQDYVANARGWGFLRTGANLTTTDGTRAVSLPTDFGKPYDVRGALRITSPSANSGTSVELMSYEDWATNEWEDGTTEGAPKYAYIRGDYIYFSPVPDATYIVAMEYFKRPTNVADTSTALTVPDRYAELLKKLVCRRLQDAGYASVQELQISDSDIERLLNQAARDDIARYGGLTFNLNPSTFNRRTV